MTDEAWRAAYQAGREAFPALSLSLEVFRARGEQVGFFAEDPPAASAPGYFFLACACAAGDVEAVAEFDRLFLRNTRAAIRRVRNDEEFVNDVCQELRSKLFTGPRPRIAEFRGRGSLGAWVRVAANRLAIDLCLSEANQPQVVGDTRLVDELAQPGVAPELALLRARYRDAFQRHLSEAFHGLTPRQRTLLRMNVLDGLSIDEIATPYRVSRATIARWLDSARSQILESVREGLFADEGMTAADFHSLERALQSQIHLSLQRLLPAEPSP